STERRHSGGLRNTSSEVCPTVPSATTPFGGTTGNANLSVSGASATAKINGSHSTTGKLTLSGGKVNGTSATDTATVGSLDWTTRSEERRVGTGGRTRLCAEPREK